MSKAEVAYCAVEGCGHLWEDHGQDLWHCGACGPRKGVHRYQEGTRTRTTAPARLERKGGA